MFRDVTLPPETAASAEPPGRRLIVTIGIDHYDEWPALGNAVSDALGVHALFVALGFHEVMPPVVNEAASGRAIRELVTEELSKLRRQDSLVVFFAGHGHVRTRQFGARRMGYLIPVDGSRKADSWLRLDVWLDEIADLPPQHILVILDACHSGIALRDIIPGRAGDEQADGVLERRRSRRVITSALDQQRARDDGPVVGHSLFTGCLIEGLPRAFGEPGDTLTGSELGIRLQRRVSEYSRQTQTPDVGVFGLDNRGEMVIPLPSGAHVAPPDRPAATVLRREPRRISTMLRRAPILGDYIDARAAMRRPGPAGTALAAGLVVLSAGWLTQASALIGLFVAGTQAYLTWIASPAVVVFGGVYAVWARDLGLRRYRHDPRLRTAAKLLALIAATVLAMRVSQAIATERDALVEGYVCSADGHPVSNATVQLIDAAGHRVGDANGTDRSGYVWLQVTPWSFRPLTIAIEAPRCNRSGVPVDAPEAGGCSAATGIALDDARNRKRLPMWKVDPCAR